jgi:hypothetical protein
VTSLVRHLRARLVRYAVALAVCQVVAVCSATIVLAAAPHAGGAAVALDEECRCEHSAGVMCPMHRRSSSRPVPADAPRWCQGTDDAAFAVLPALGTLALPERIAPLTPTTVESLAPAFRAEAPRPLARPPDSPPPRL